MYTYHSLKELFDLADKAECSPGIIACRAEAEESEKSCEEVWNRMKKTIPVFRNAIRQGLSDTGKSASGLVGGDASRLYHGKMRFLSPICQRAASYALATAESNAKMHRVVACPTAGACGILPAVIAAVSEEENSGEEDITRALFTAGAVGRIVAEKASIAGAVGGCQAECGTACGMGPTTIGFFPVSFITADRNELRSGGTTEEMGHAFALAVKNILGLVCDPVGGLVEVPCVKRNAFHAVHALTSVEMVMSGIRSVIPPDEVIEALNDVGRRLPVELRETSLAGLAMTPTGRRINKRLEECARKV